MIIMSYRRPKRIAAAPRPCRLLAPHRRRADASTKMISAVQNRAISAAADARSCRDERLVWSKPGEGEALPVRLDE